MNNRRENDNRRWCKICKETYSEINYLKFHGTKCKRPKVYIDTTEQQKKLAEFKEKHVDLIEAIADYYNRYIAMLEMPKAKNGYPLASKLRILTRKSRDAYAALKFLNTQFKKDRANQYEELKRLKLKKEKDNG